MGKTPSCNADGRKKVAWSPDEDQKLKAHIQKHGEGGWRTLPQKADLKRCGKSCRLRWANYLRPGIKRGEFSSEEEQQIIQLHATLGNKWSAIARRLQKRTDNEIKNYWNTHIKRRLWDMGIDPVTHKPVGPSLIPSASDTMGNSDLNPRCDENETAHYDSSMSNKGSAHLLNKLATKLASFSCLDVTVKDNQDEPSRDGDINNNCDRGDVIVIEANSGDTSDVDSPILLLGSPEQLQSMPRPVSKSTRLLNELASGLKTSLHRIDSLRSILSESIDVINAGRSPTTTCLSDSTTTASNTSISVWNSSGLLDQISADSPVPLDPFDLDSLLDGSTVVGCGDTRDKPTISACGSSDLFNFLVPSCSVEFNEALAADEQEKGFSRTDAFEVQ